mgnify:CR=1 FL=1
MILPPARGQTSLFSSASVALLHLTTGAAVTIPAAYKAVPFADMPPSSAALLRTLSSDELHIEERCDAEPHHYCFALVFTPTHSYFLCARLHIPG